VLLDDAVPRTAVATADGGFVVLTSGAGGSARRFVWGPSAAQPRVDTLPAMSMSDDTGFVGG
jgi:hypothetical protein